MKTNELGRAAFESAHPHLQVARVDITGAYANSMTQECYKSWLRAKEQALLLCRNSEVYWGNRGNPTRATNIAVIRTNIQNKM